MCRITLWSFCWLLCPKNLLRDHFDSFSLPLYPLLLPNSFSLESGNQWAQWATRSFAWLNWATVQRAWEPQLGVNQGIQPPLLPPGSVQWKHLKGKHIHTLCRGAPLHPPSLGSPRSQHHGPGQSPAEAFTGIRLALEHGCRCRRFRACVGCGICLLGWEEDFSWRREVS